MKLVNVRSLAETVDRVNEAFSSDKKLTRLERKRAAEWIAKRQGLKGAYASMFAPTAYDFEKGVRVFTGERITSGAAIGHILGEETSRALILLGIDNALVRNALHRATRGMQARLNASVKRNRGFYCCGTCTAALWRHLTAGGLDHSATRLRNGVTVLKKYRDGHGRWRRFPFYYTLLALTEIDTVVAKAEISYAAQACVRLVSRQNTKDKYGRRRLKLLETVLQYS